MGASQEAESAGFEKQGIGSLKLCGGKREGWARRSFSQGPKRKPEKKVIDAEGRMRKDKKGDGGY